MGELEIKKIRVREGENCEIMISRISSVVEENTIKWRVWKRDSKRYVTRRISTASLSVTSRGKEL